MATIHPTAVVDARAQLAPDVVVGPFVVIEGRVTIGAGTVVQSHSVLKGPTRIGSNCKIGPAAYVGLDPQSLRSDTLDGWLIVGDGSMIREGATAHRATHDGEENATRLGEHCFLMSCAHVAHDCILGDDVILANTALLGGHCVVGNRAFLGGGSTIHQFCRIGRLAVIAGNEQISHDVPPFAAARYGGLKGYNAVGCKRAGMSREAIYAVRRAYQMLHQNRTTPDVVAAMEEIGDMPEVREIVDFIAGSKRGVLPSVRFFRASLPSSARVENIAD